jgi:dTDP-4-dehydrorhamnose reductase
MKILVLGANGMLGHKLMQVLCKQHSVTGTVRVDAENFSNDPILSRFSLVGNVSADDITTIEKAAESIKPEIIINCIGIVKQLPTANDPLSAIAINALFPHQLAKICRQKDIRLIHLSTDCIFSGRKGNYTEEDPSDAEDLYGKTKFLGEVTYPGCLTIRTSIIGREIDSNHGLIEWFLKQEGKTVSGFKKAIFSGLTTNALSTIIEKIITDFPDLHGVRQIASEPISKYDLLTMVKKTYHLTIAIEPDEAVVNDRSLLATKFTTETKIKIPSWEYMVTEMYKDPTPYTTLRGNHAQR